MGNKCYWSSGTVNSNSRCDIVPSVGEYNRLCCCTSIEQTSTTPAALVEAKSDELVTSEWWFWIVLGFVILSCCFVIYLCTLVTVEDKSLDSDSSESAPSI